jgi:hypothetical protein
LYDHRVDPNLLRPIVAQLEKWLPTINAAPAEVK